MNDRKVCAAPAKAVRVIALILVFAVIFSVAAVSASAYEVKGKTLAEVLGMDGEIYYKWIKEHEHDTYYNTTPYAHADHRNPNGDCQDANGALDVPGVPAMNCMGFVWHILFMPTRMSGGNTSMIPAYGKGGWLGLYTGYNVTRRYFSSKKELLQSGYAEAGDIIWCFVVNENVPDDSNHICVYMGDGHSDKVWHSVGAGCVFGPIRTGYDQYVVLKSGVICKLDTPVLKAAVNTVKGPKIAWKKVKGAAGYRVFVKNGEKWKPLGDVKGNTFVDKTAKNNTKYTYTVRCLNRNGDIISDFDKKGISIVYYEAPSGFSADCVKNKITFSWKAVEGAAKYRIYRRTAGKDWTMVGKTTKTSFTDTKVTTAKMYQYTVRVVNKKDESVSDMRTPLTTYILNGVPKISGAVVGTQGVRLTWNKVNGAEQYVVYKRTNGKWVKLGTTKKTSFLNTKPQNNVATYYAVRCANAKGNVLTSDVSTEAFSAMYQTPPVMKSIEAAENGLKLKWRMQKNAKLYRVFRKNANGKWVKLADVTGNTYTDTTAQTGKKYSYTLRVMSADGKTALSMFDNKGWSIKYSRAPKVIANPTPYGVRVRWSKRVNAVKYRVYVKDNGTWRTVGDTSKDTFFFADVKDGGRYLFTVRTVDANGWQNSWTDAVAAAATYTAPKAS